MSRFRNFSSALIFGFVCCVHPAAQAQNPSNSIQPALVRCDSPVRAVGMTYLHALPGQRENLKQYILKNWFIVDAKAVEEGLMKSFALWESSEPKAGESWDFIVVDTWCNEQGYEGVSSRFTALSIAHKSIPVDGKHFEQLGRRGLSKAMIERR
jgi:hypothetical protein